MKLQKQAQSYVALTFYNSFFVCFVDIMRRNFGAVARASASFHQCEPGCLTLDLSLCVG